MTTSTTELVDSSPELEVVAGVDTHADTHHVAVVSITGARLGDLQVPTTTAGYERLLNFIRSFGSTRLVGVEGTSSYGAGLTRYLMAQGVEIREIVRPRRAQRRHGKSDPIDAYAAAAQALAEPETLPMAKTGEGVIEQIRVLLSVRRSAIKARVAVIRQIKSLLITAPEAIRTRWEGLNERCLIESLASTRPGPATGSVATATGQALRRLARRHQYLTVEITELEDDLRVLVGQAAPAMIATKGYGVITTATLLITAGANPERLRSEASFAALCGASPIPASSGKTNRYRLNRGGDRQANWALHQIALVRLSNEERTRSYAGRLRASGKSKKDVLRCLKRAIAREAFHLIVHPHPVPATEDLRDLRHQRGATLLQAAMSIGAEPARLSELERGKRPNADLATTYRAWLTTL
ncbi:IS110 family transposase [Kocuria rhizophila]|uniref:IS110 family transposase n=1 Tax=Kocuria rhizophila TaxID=72000 RepID=UPI000C7A4DDC|nr:IS110 family transposase [Kocuria rhizophila]PKZ37035.1 IS110 family transposase [Kocuria rhizophila]